MTITIIDSATYTAPNTIVVPSGTDDHHFLSSYLLSLGQDLANRTAYLKSKTDVAAYTNASNTYSGTNTFNSSVTINGTLTTDASHTVTIGQNLDVNGNADVLGGNLRVLNNHDLLVTGSATIGSDGSGNLEVNGTGTFKDGVTVGDDGSGDLTVRGSGSFDSDITSGGEFSYSSAQSKSIICSMAGGTIGNNFDFDATAEKITTTGDAGTAMYAVPIRIASGSELVSVDVQGGKATSNLTLRIVRWTQADWSGSPSPAFGSIIATGTISSTGLNTVTLNCGNYVIYNDFESYSLVVLCSTSGASGDSVERFRVNYNLPGPRSY